MKQSLSNKALSSSSKYLIDESPMMVLPSLASRIGIDEAIILQQIQYWIRTHEASGNERVYREGRWWVYNSIQQWQERQFIWLSVPTVKRILQGLEQMTLITSRQFERTSLNNEKPSNRKWYTINYESVNALDLVPEKTCFVKVNDRINLILTLLNGNRPDQFDPNLQIKLIPTTRSNRSQASDQIDPVFLIYKETTYQETTQEINNTQVYDSLSPQNPEVDLVQRQEEQPTQVEYPLSQELKSTTPQISLSQQQDSSGSVQLHSQEQSLAFPPHHSSQALNSIQPQPDLSQGLKSSIIPFPSQPNLNSDKNSGLLADVATNNLDTLSEKKQKNKKSNKLTEDQLQYFLEVYRQEKPSNFANHGKFSEKQINALNKLVEEYSSRSLDIFAAALKFVREDQNDWWRKGSFTLSHLMSNSKMIEYADSHFTQLESDKAYHDRIEEKAPSKDKGRKQEQFSVSVVDSNGRTLDPNGATAQCARALANNPMLQRMLAIQKKKSQGQ